MVISTRLDRQPRLHGRFVLRPLCAADHDALFAVAADPAIWAGHPAPDRWQASVFRRFFDDALASGGALVVIDPVTGAMIGSSRYDFTRAEADEVEIGWSFLARVYWGGSANAAVKAMLLRHALAAVERVIFIVGEGNIRSRRAMEKIGGVLSDRRLDVQLGSDLVRHVVFVIDRAGFAAGPLHGVGDT